MVQPGSSGLNGAEMVHTGPPGLDGPPSPVPQQTVLAATSGDASTGGDASTTVSTSIGDAAAASGDASTGAWIYVDNPAANLADLTSGLEEMQAQLNSLAQQIAEMQARIASVRQQQHK